MAIDVANSNQGTGSATTTFTTASINSAATGSTFVIGIASTANLDATYTGCNDNKGNTYTQVAAAQTFGAGPWSIKWWYVNNGAGGSGHTGTVTTGSNHTGVVFLLEITGGTLTSILDQQNSQADTSSPFTSPNITTTQANELLLTLASFNGGANPGNPTENSGNFTKVQENTNGASFFNCGIWKRVVNATGTYNASWTETNSPSTEAAVAILSLKARLVAPSIIDQPVDDVAIFGDPVGFTVNASSDSGAALSYQWTENGANVGTNSSSFSTSQTFAADQNARFAVSVWDTNGTTQSINAYVRLTTGSGYYVQETVSSDRYQLEDASGNYLIEPWGGTTAAATLLWFFVGPTNGLGSSGRTNKNRLH